MSYANYTQDYPIKLAPTRTDGDSLFVLPVAPGETVVIYGLKAWMTTAGSAAGCGLDLKIDGAAASYNLTTGNATGRKTNAVSSPLVVTGAASTGSKIEVLQETTDTAGIGTAFLTVERPRP